MNKEDLKLRLNAYPGPPALDESGEFLTVQISSEELLPLMQFLHKDKDLHFDYLFCLTCVDWKDHLMMVYFLTSTVHQHNLVVKAKISDIVNPQIESVDSLWKTAELNENEVFDLFGVKFNNHPNLRRMFMEADWNGYPLRKNYTDENMIKL